MMGNADPDDVKAYTDTIRDEAELFAMRLFYKNGRFSEEEVNDFFRALRTIILSLKSVNGSQRR